VVKLGKQTSKVM